MRFWICGGALLVAASGLLGCGSVQSTSKLRDARQSVAQAEGANVEEFATYEFVLAQSYLEKARHEWAQSDWQQAKRYAELATHWAELAHERARSQSMPTGVER